jgi:hypothetical protein
MADKHKMGAVAWRGVQIAGITIQLKGLIFQVPPSERSDNTHAERADSTGKYGTILPR